MPTVVASVAISAPAEAVAEVLLDAELAPIWTAGLSRLELLEGKVGEPGSIGLAHYERGTSRYVLEDRLLSVDPGRRYVSQVSGGGLRARVETTLEEAAGETTVTIRWAGTGTNPITRVLLPLMRRRIAKQARADLTALRDLVESAG